MKILITGSTGLVGSHLSEKLSLLSNEVYALVRTKSKWEEWVKKASPRAMKFITPIFGELENFPMEQLPADLDAVIHLAAVVHSHSPEEFFKQNSEATKKFFANLVAHYPTQNRSLKFINVSSLAAHGNNHKDRKHDLPVSSYGKSKLLAEQFIREQLPKSWSLEIVRPPIVMGERDLAFLEVAKMLKRGYYLAPGNNGDELHYSFISVHDLVEFLLNVLNSDNQAQTRTYYPAYPKAIKYDDLCNIIATKAGFSSPKKYTIPKAAIRPLAVLISFLATSIIPALKNIRLTRDKSNEILAGSWLTPYQKEQALEKKFEYKYDFALTAKMTMAYYKEQGYIK
ncbi:MAG: NAD(P)-dependent oxidoreductase [Oligoflexia bacterium]|nr:NAD(P)-dependent oxidoreductase [Oligoflexia bacterium]MBF0365890.1 NAD(P)-dependent oxidoreductase [Oligoflexia bacterium]